MSIEQRAELYSKMEKLRKRPLLVYVTSSRGNSAAQIAGDVVPEFLDQLQALPSDCKELDLLLVSNGGDPTVAWRVVSLVRERVEKFSVLVPQAAFSAATLIALGADEIVMHPHGNLGPTDPQIMVNKRNQGNGQTDTVPFGSEDLGAFVKYARESVGITDQAQLKDVFLKFCDEVGTVAIGVAARSSQLGVVMGEKLLQLHMTGDSDQQKARAISEKLTRDYFHHGYPVSKTEAREIGLKVAHDSAATEDLMWQIWTNISEELLLRQPFNPLTLIANDPTCAGFLTPAPAPPPMAPLAMPADMPPEVAQQMQMQMQQQMQFQAMQQQTATTRFENILAIVESSRLASRYVMAGTVVALKLPPHQIQMQTVVDQQEWRTVWTGDAPKAPVAKDERVKKAVKKPATKKVKPG